MMQCCHRHACDRCAIERLTEGSLCAAVLAPYNSFKWMGCVICFVAMVGVAPIYFPMWGGLVCGPKKGYTEEDYYFSEYTPAEREAGHHLASSKFVSSCPSAYYDTGVTCITRFRPFSGLLMRQLYRSPW